MIIGYCLKCWIERNKADALYWHCYCHIVAGSVDCCYIDAQHSHSLANVHAYLMNTMTPMRIWLNKKWLLWRAERFLTKMKTSHLKLQNKWISSTALISEARFIAYRVQEFLQSYLTVYYEKSSLSHRCILLLPLEFKAYSQWVNKSKCM